MTSIFQYILFEASLEFLLYLEFFLCKAEEPLRVMELQENEEEKIFKKYTKAV